VLAQVAGKTWLVLGDMGELGETAAELHAAAGAGARAAGIRRLYGLGELACLAVENFQGPGGCFSDMDVLLAALRADLTGPLHILVKGSRRMRMERVIDALRAELQDVVKSNGGRG